MERFSRSLYYALTTLDIRKMIEDIISEDGFLKEVSYSDIENLPTTLSGYGISDAYIDNGTIYLGSNSITPLLSIPIASSNVLGGIKVGTGLSVDADGVLSATGISQSISWSDVVNTPTTLNGYGITDAYISAGTITLGSDSITPLTSFTETDPVFSASDVASVTSSDISNWNTAYGWGDHSQAGYLTSFTETDPIFSASAAAGISSSDITSWNGKYTKPVGGIPGTDLADTYLTSYTETDPTVPNWAKAVNKPSYNFSEIGSTPTTLSGYGITDAKIQSGVITLGSDTITPLTSFTETDPTVPSWAKALSKPSYSLTEISGTTDLQLIEALTGGGLLKRNANNTWSLDTNSYLTSYTETDPVFGASAAAGISSSDISTWNAKQKAITISSSEPTSGDGSNGDIWIVI